MKTALDSPRFVVSRFFYEEAFRHFPILKENYEYRVFFWYLCFGTHFDAESNQLLLCRDTIADLLETDRVNFNTSEFFARFARDVLGKPNFQWSAWREGHCRQLVELNVGDFTEILQGEYAGLWDETLWISLDGAKWSAAKARHARRCERALAQRVPTDCREAEFIQNYLNRLPCNRFTKNVGRNYRAACRFAVESLSDARKRQRELRLLASIRLQPQPFYSASSKGNTVRLFTRGTIPDLKREIRRVLTQGWQDADLRCSQLAICARAWRIEAILSRLRSKESVWQHLFSFFDLPEQIKPEAKAIFKKALYSICFGMEEGSLKWSILKSAPRPLGARIAARFLDIPMIQELLRARHAALEEVIRNGGATNCFEKFIKIRGDVQPRDILAQVAQAWEMKLILPAFELASKSTDFIIGLFQHDGFSVHFRRREEVWRKKISDVVNTQAVRFGIPTSLEWDETDPNQSEFPFTAVVGSMGPKKEMPDSTEIEKADSTEIEKADLLL